MKLYSPVISGSLTVTGSTTFIGNITMSGSLLATASNASLLTGTGSVGFTTTGSFTTMSGSVSTRVSQIESVYATTGSNSFRATQSITGSLTVTGQIIAQTLNVQQVTSSIVYSSGSNVFGCDINSRQVFTGSFYQTGSVAYFAGNVGVSTLTPTNGKLEVQQTSTSPGLWVQTGGTTSAYTIADFRTGTNLSALQILGNATSSFQGNVGIKTSSPNDLLEIYGTTNQGMTICSSDQPRLGFYVGGGSADNKIWDFIPQSNNAFIARVVNDAKNSASTWLSVTRNGTCISNICFPQTNSTITIMGCVGVGVAANADGQFRLAVDRQLRVEGSSTPNNIVLGIGGTGVFSIDAPGVGGGRFVINDCGRVGVGTTDTSFGMLTLMCTDNTCIGSTQWGSSAASNLVTAVYNTSQCVGSAAGIRLITRNSGASIWNMYNISTGPSSGDLAFGNGSGGTGSEKMRLTNGGALAIGASGNFGKLLVYDTGCVITSGDVTFDTQAKGIELYNACSGNTDNLIGYWFSVGPHKSGIASGRTNAGAGWELDLRFFTHNSATSNLNHTYENMRLYGNGNLTINGSLTPSGGLSDINLKENLMKISSPLNKLSQINGYTFDWKKGTPPNGEMLNIVHDAGLIAQEIEEVLPDIVRNNKYDGTKMLNYNGVTALLVEAIKEQQCTINLLKTCIGIA